jgi:hypothetical protein
VDNFVKKWPPLRAQTAKALAFNTSIRKQAVQNALKSMAFPMPLAQKGLRTTRASIGAVCGHIWPGDACV